MHRMRVNAIVDLIVFVCFLCLSSTGIILHFLLPPRSGQSLNIWGLDRHEWGEIHFWIAVVLFAVLIVHLVLHWRWIVSVVKGNKPEHSGKRALLGLVGLVAILVLVFSPVISEPDEAGDRQGMHKGQENRYGRGP